MTAAGWRYFGFFDVDEVDLTADKVDSIVRDAALLETGRGKILIANKDGSIHVLSRSFSIIHSFIAYQNGRTTHMKQLRQRNMLVTLGEEEDTGSTPILRVWDFDRIDRRTQAPALQRSFKVQIGDMPFPVSAFACLESLAQVAFGLADGRVLLLRGDISRDRTAKPKVIHDSNEPITGLGFREEAKKTSLYIITTSRILSCVTLGKESGQPSVKVDDIGAALGCSAFHPISQDLYIATDDTVLVYDGDSRGPSFALEGYKTSIHLLKSYLAILAPLEGSHDATRITIFDTANKYIAYAGTFADGIRGVAYEWGELFVFTFDGKVHRLVEKDTFTKLDILFKKNLYLLAINLAHSQQYDDSSIAEIFCKYGDHLYDKGDFDTAMHQYIRTIGQLEPSYVIRKFLDAQRIHNLTTYLEELHSQGFANAEHTTLLLNCYTKSKVVTQLDKFIRNEAYNSSFDLETAISVLRKSGYRDHAVFLAEKFGDTSMYLRIQIEDAAEYGPAVQYIRGLSVEAAATALKSHGKVLMDNLPDETTQVMTDLCTGNLYKMPDPVRSPNGTIGNGYLGFSILPNFGTASPTSNSSSGNPNEAPANPSRSPRLTHEEEEEKDAYKRLAVRSFAHIFVDHPVHFTRFLEAVAASWGYHMEESGKMYAPVDDVDDDAADKKMVWNTLIELYLGESGMEEIQGDVAKTKERMLRREKAMRIMQNPHIDIDENQALILCFLANYIDGVVYLYERMGMYEDIVRFHMSRDDTPRVIAALHKYGPKVPSVYPLTITYFTSSPTTLDASRNELLEVLEYIDKEKLMPPLQVIQALGQSGFATVGMVREYLTKRVEGERAEAEGNAKLVTSYKLETEAKRREIQELRKGTRIVQATRCSACGGNLDLPAVHFACKHSFHERCVGENEDGEDTTVVECPSCAPSNRRVNELRKVQTANALNTEGFFARLAEAEDGFAVISEWFSKGAIKSVGESKLE